MKEIRKKELLKLECKSCGSSLEMSDKTHARCTHCNRIYMIDELGHELFDIQVDYGDNTHLKKTLSKSKKALLISICVALAALIGIFCVNIGAILSAFSSADSKQDLKYDGQLIKIFCEDIFDKEYDQITPEEFDSIKYIKTSHNPEGNSSDFYHTIEYSFYNYEDCENEEAFQKTIQQWSHGSQKAYPWIDDYTMFTGLTRIDTREDRLGLSEIQFADNCPISYVDTMNSPLCVAETLNPENIKVLHAKIYYYGPAGLDKFTNLEELVSLGTYYYDGDEEPMDISLLKSCKKLRVLNLDCANGYSGTNALSSLSDLETVSLSYTLLSDCEFLKDLPYLKELHICAGENADLSLLSQLTTLEKLYFMDYVKLGSAPLSHLSSLTNLTELGIQLETADSLKKLTSLKRLKKLDLSLDSEFGSYLDGTVYNLSSLTELPVLEDLTITLTSDEGCYLGVTELLNSKGLRCFALYGSGFTSYLKVPFNPQLLEENPNLEKITISEVCLTDSADEKISDYSFLTKYKNLKEICLSGCDLSDISFMADLPQLEKVAFWKTIISSYNDNLTDFSPLLKCRKLKTLYVDEKDLLNVTFPQDVDIFEKDDFYDTV